MSIRHVLTVSVMASEGASTCKIKESALFSEAYSQLHLQQKWAVTYAISIKVLNNWYKNSVKQSSDESQTLE